jgi:hypothetical protein
VTNMSELIQNDKMPLYTVAEFAALFKKERTWAYKKLNAGKIHAITGYGYTLIPHSEYERIQNDKQRYLGRRRTPGPKKGGEP